MKKICTAPKGDICKESCADVCNGKTPIGNDCKLYRQVKLNKDYKGDGSGCDWGEDE